MSRARTRERRKERQQQQRRQQQLYVTAGLIVLVIAAFAVFILVNQPAEAPIPTQAQERYEGFNQNMMGKTDEGYPVLGNPDAPVQVVEYSSFDCPHCLEFHETVFPSLIDRIQIGQVAFTYVPIFGTSSIPNGEGAARAAICAGEQDKFWPYHDALFTWQSLYGNQAFSQNRLSSGVDNLGISRAAWDQCMRTDLPDRVIFSAQEAETTLPSYGGTPTILVNGTVVENSFEAVTAEIDAAFAQAGQPPAPDIESTAEPEATADSTAEATEEATEEATDSP